MEKKATILLFRLLLSALTWVVAGLTIAAWFAGIVPPQKSWFITILGLGLMPLLTVNLLLMIWWVIRRRRLAVVPAIALLLNTGFIVSMIGVNLGLSSGEHKGKTIKVATYNIHGYAQRDWKGMLESFVDYIRREGIDVIGFQEFPVTQRFTLDSVKAVFGEYMPYCVAGDHNSPTSVALFSRYPVSAHGILRYEKTQNGAMWADIEISGETIRFINAHLQTTSINQSHHELESLRERGITDYEGKMAFDVVMKRLYDNAIRRKEQVDAVRAIMDTTTYKTIVCGDFNSPPSSYCYRQVKKGMRDGFRQCGSGYAYTFKPMFKLLRIDYIFYDKRCTGLSYRSPNLMWSDHNPVVMKLSLGE